MAARLPRQRTQIPRQLKPHPSRGGCEGYDFHFRTSELALSAAGLPTTASGRSLRRWRRRQHPYDKNGNHAPSVFTDEDRVLLLMYRFAYPKVRSPEVARALAVHSSRHKFYTDQQIIDEETAFSLTTKRGSTTANQAFTPLNMLRRNLFWTQPAPLGVVGTPRQDLIDVDEAGLMLKCVNRSTGKAYVGCRVRESGPYGHTDKWTIILAVDCAGRRWMRFRKVAGTSAAVFDTFIRRVIRSLPSPRGANPGPVRTFLWDNLTSHHSPIVMNSVYAAGHRVVPRAPYRPCDGPIEFVFNQLQRQLTARLYKIRNDADLVREVHSIVMNLGGFNATFLHCGY